METENRLLGLLFIIIGIVQFYWVIKYPADKNDASLADVKGILGGIGFIGLGIAMMIGSADFFNFIKKR